MPMFGLIVMIAFIVALVDIILRDQSQVKHLPKVAWVFVVILIPVLGPILWFTLGREYASRPARPMPYRGANAAPSGPRYPADYYSTEQQLADLEKEIEEERLRAELARRRAAQDGADEGDTAR